MGRSAIYTGIIAIVFGIFVSTQGALISGVILVAVGLVLIIAWKREDSITKINYNSNKKGGKKK